MTEQLKTQLDFEPTKLSASRFWDPDVFERRRAAIRHYTQGEERTRRLTELAEETYLDRLKLQDAPTVYDAVIHAALEDPAVAEEFFDPQDPDGYSLIVDNNGQIQDLTYHRHIPEDRAETARVRQFQKRAKNAPVHNTIRIGSLSR